MLGAYLDLAAQPAIFLGLKDKAKHLLFKILGLTHGLLPMFVNVAMAGRAGTGAATVGHNGIHSVIHRRPHQAFTFFRLQRVLFSVVFYKSNLNHKSHLAQTFGTAARLHPLSASSARPI